MHLVMFVCIEDRYEALVLSILAFHGGKDENLCVCSPYRLYSVLHHFQSFFKKFSTALDYPGSQSISACCLNEPDAYMCVQR